MVLEMEKAGISIEKHHHEVAPAQHELGLKFNTLTQMADNMNLYKYIIHQVAASYGKSATFMPKPYFKDNGSGMHVHQSIWKAGKPAFAGYTTLAAAQPTASTFPPDWAPADRLAATRRVDRPTLERT